MALPLDHRLKHWRDFQTVYQQGKRFRSAHLIVIVRSTPDRPSRFGLVVSQKVSKKAVDRNRLKRRLRLALRQLLPRISPHWSCVIILKPHGLACECEHFLRELEQTLIQAEVLHGHS